MIIGIEKFEITISLFGYTYGEVKNVKLHGVIGLEFKIENLEEERKFIVDLEMSICMETNGTCEITIPVLISTALPKAPCDWKNDYVQSDFSFLGFLNEKGIDVNDNLDTNQLSALIERLAIGDFLMDTQCSSSASPYSGHSDGWTNLCGQFMATLPTVSGTVCNVGSDCTTVYCCLPDTRIGKSFETFVKFEPCLFRLSVGIDKLTFSTLLFDYEWGQLTEVWFFGYVRMEFTVRDLEMEGDYLIDMKLQICRESDTETTPCGVDIIIFDKYRLPKLSCDWNSGLYSEFQGLTTWLTDNSVTKTEPLRGSETSKLMSDSGIASYLYEPSCDQQGSMYSGNVGGVKNDCGTPVSVPVLPSGVVCTVSADTCTGLDCCITIPLTNKTMNFRININHCYQDITVGLESMYREYKLLDYTFGTMEHFNLRGVGKMEYKIEDFIGEGAYLIDISFSFCLETGSCEFTETIIQGVKFPKKICTWDDTYRVKDFSLDQWSRERSIDTTQVYPAYYISELLQNLDLTRYFQLPQCNRSSATYDSPINGWIKDCNDTEVVPISTNPMTCRLKSDCAAISCCLDEKFISKTFVVVFEIDDCERKIYIGIEKLKFYIPLHDFEFDTWHEFSLVKTIRIRYNVYNLWSEGVYMVSLEISSCWERYGSCAWTQSVLDYARFKKQMCASQMAYQNAGFSLTTWATSRSIDKDAMTKTDLTRLYDELDIAWYLKNTCDFEMSPFIANGWNNTCSSTINNLPMLSSGTSCYISDVCTDVRCCVSVPLLGNHTFDFSLNLDGCTQFMEISLENYKEQLMLRDYTFGVENYLWIKGVLRLKYTIDDLPDQNLYRVSVMFEVCTTNGAPCEYSLTVMDSIELPRPSCLPHWSYGYAEVGFTKEQWKTSRGLEDDATLNSWQISKLLEETELALYQNKPRCNRTMGDYQGSQDGWVNNCTLGVSPGVLDGDIVCLIGSKCSEVSCCVNDPETMSDFNAYLSLDPCEFTLLIGVEKYSFEVSLIGFDFEKSYELDLGGIYRVSFSVDDLMYSGMYVVNMTVSICWSSGQDCQFVSQVFQNTLLPKHTCDTQTDFAQSGFSYISWLNDTGYTDATPLVSDALDDLEEVLDIVKFYESTGYTVVNVSSNGWNDECELGMVELPDISPAANCTLQPHCTAIDCSIFSPRLGRSFHAAVDIDPCHARMMVQIEKMNFNVGLLEKQYGDLWQVWLRGIVRIDFTINNLLSENMYLVNMNLSVCFESSGACEVGPVNIFVNTLLPKKTCDFSSDFVVTGFSLEAMIHTYHLTEVTTLPSYFVQQVLNTASVSQYLLEQSCNRLTSPFGTTYDGWMKGCTTQSLTLEYIKPTETTCYTLPDCTGFQCCVDASVIGRSFLYKISVDACKYKLTVAIEGLEYEQNLLTYKFGTQDKFYINGVFKMDYQIEELPIDGSYLLTVTLSVCLEANADCAVQRVVASSLKLDKPTCTSTGQFAIPGFSVTDWKASKGLGTSDELPEYAASLLMSDMKIAKYMKEPQCIIASPGWQSGGCPLTIDKPMLHDNVTCQVTSSCTGVKCCLYTEELHRNIDVHLLLNPCDQRSLQKFYMENVVRVDYVIYDLTNEFKYLVDMNVSICYESSAPCELESMIFHSSVLYKKPCQWKTGFRDPNFSESGWRNEMNITSDAQLFPVDIARLTEALYVGPYQSATPCQGYNSPYTGAINGWKDECSASNLENLPSNTMKCYIPATCSFIRCCHEVSLLGTPMETELEIDSCNFELSVRIEKLEFKVPFHDYQWGVVQSMDLFGLLTMDFAIENLYESRQFLVSMNLTLSYESAGPVEAANILMDKVLLSKKQCDWSSDFHISGFSLNTYLLNRNHRPTDPLTPNLLLQFMEDTNLAPFMQDEMCNQTGALYNNQSWTQDCAANLALPTLSDKVNGHITTMCTGVEGCIENDLIKRSIQFSLLLDPCSNRLSISIERARYNRTLDDFEYGFSKTQWYADNGIPDGQVLPDWAASSFLNDLHIAAYLQTEQCGQTDLQYTDGWNLANLIDDC
ncbi:uncharacterized protein LOC127720826 [Mytilus californianus]|uniref:uncharacterized protein LOC127720826 n=1 Tax=Mytilus californianus TaxID=6549 RepID=UPI002246AE98|nr:uncharacterized protein LOC127720826 [Mytilus californianus]